MQHQITLSDIGIISQPRKGFFTRLGELLDRWLAKARAWVVRWRRPEPELPPGIDLEAEIARSKQAIRNVIERYEAKYGMSSDEFYAQWLSDDGDMEENLDFQIWSWACPDKEWAYDRETR